MAREWTAAQKAAIEETGKTLLVSAAAGAGKTATLTERIIRTLTDPAHPADIMRMLIVTFTRAAASELRSRLATALNEQMRVRHSSHLARTLLLLPGAAISTIDSFCLTLVRVHASSLGLSPSFRLSDPAETRLLMHSVMERLVEDCYAGEAASVCDNAEFCALADCLTGSRGDAELPSLLLALYEKTRGFARSYFVVADMAQELSAMASAPPFSGRIGAQLRARVRAQAEGTLSRYNYYKEAFAHEPDVAAAYLPAYEEEAAALQQLLAALDVGYTAARHAVFGMSRARVGSLRADRKTGTSIAAQQMRDNFFSKTLKYWQSRYFAYTEEQWGQMLPRLAERIGTLGRLLIAFGERVEAEKRRRNLCDFGDLEHAALRLLTDADGRPTALAHEVRAEYDWIYIDEYQDVNEVQHRIFEAVSGERNRFMVGDVKQSIYAFRGAQPEIFAGVRAAWPPLSAAAEAPAATLSLSANFRSTPAILSFVNRVFGRLMEVAGEAIGYTEEDRLIPGRADAEPGARVTVAVFAGRPGESRPAEEEPGESQPEEGPEADSVGETLRDRDPEDGGEDEKPDAEARWVAAQIRQLLSDGQLSDGRRIRPGDIAVLTRNGAASSRFAHALEEAGIPCEASARRGFFLNPEILLALSLLNVIDNPRRDIYLAGLLRSPLYGFSMDDLIAIRGAQEPERRQESLYEALCAYSEQHPEFRRGHLFLGQLAEYRNLAESWPVDRLIWRLYRETGLLALAGADRTGAPEARRANLMLLYDYARRFEASSYRGLYNFIAYINEAIERGQSIEEARNTSDRADMVRLLTVHQSKGLEFPVCFLAACGTSFNRTDLTAPVLFDRHLGCALRLRDETGFARLRNPVYNLIGEAMADDATEEEMRVLYVALTRARERLYVSGSVPDPEGLRAAAAERARFWDGTAARSCRNYMEMILTAAGEDDSYDLLFPTETDEKTDPYVVTGEQQPEKSAWWTLETDKTTASDAQNPPMPADRGEPEDPEEARLYALFSKRFAQSYPDRYLTDLPRKLSVSRLFPSVLDGSGEEEFPHLPDAGSAQDVPVGASAFPAFFREDSAGEDPDVCAAPAPEGETRYRRADPPRFLTGRRDSAAQAGTATHLFLQFCDFDRLCNEGGEAERRRLVKAGFLTAEDAALVRMGEIEAFRRSDLLATLRGGGRVYRELRFHARLPAACFTDDPARRAAYGDRTLLVQGVIDGIHEDTDGRLWLFDYKTDRLGREAVGRPDLAAGKLLARHRLQLLYYTAACRRIFGRLPDRVSVYSLALGQTVDLRFSAEEVP